MQTNLLAKLVSILLVCCFINAGEAQSVFRYKAELEDVDTAGFYEIVLLPAVTAKLQPGFRDIRIVDVKGEQVPYMLQSDILTPVNYTSLSEMPILSNKKGADKLTHVVIENNLRRRISSLVLFIKNTEATRRVTIAGSDNNRQWYVIKEGVEVDNLFTDSSESIAHELVFPNSSYQFFKLIIHGTDVLPFNVTRVCTSGHSINPPADYLSIPSPYIHQTDSSDRFSYVTLRFNDFYLVNKLVLKVSGRRFYRRTINVYSSGILLNENGPLILSSNAPPIYSIDSKTNVLLLTINNEDNPPVKISEVSAFQLKWSLLTWLEKGSKYNIIFGDSTARAPDYDLEFFKDSIQTIPRSLTYGPPQQNLSAQKKKSPKAAENKIIMWGVITVVLAVLLFFTFRLTKEIDKKV